MFETKRAGEIVVGDVVCEADGVGYDVIAVSRTAATTTLTIKPQARAFFSSMRGMPETLTKRVRSTTRIYVGKIAGSSDDYRW